MANTFGPRDRRSQINLEMDNRLLTAAIRKVWIIGSPYEVKHHGSRAEVERDTPPTNRSGCEVSLNSVSLRCLIVLIPMVVPLFGDVPSLRR